MVTKNTLPKMVVLLTFLMPLMSVADNSKTIDPYAAAKAEPKEGEIIKTINLDDSNSYAKEKTEPQPIKPKPKQSPPKKQTNHAPKPPKKVIKKHINTKKTPPKKTVAKHPPKRTARQEPEINLRDAYEAVMRSDNKKRIVKKQIAPSPSRSPASSSNNPTGWLYLGKFTQGQWASQGNQVLGLTTLPQLNHYYSLHVGSNIRNNKPSKGKMPPVIKILSTGSKIKLLAIHNSGGSGHYWAKITW